MKSASRSGSKPKSAAFKPYIDTVCAYAEENGISNAALTTLIDLVRAQSVLDQSSQNALLKALYPVEKIPSTLVCNIVSSLGPGKRKASETTQQALLKWLLLVYDLLEKPKVLSQLYSVLFNLLDIFYLRSHLCQLLARITRKKHVTPVRIALLRQLEQGTTQDHPLLKLVSVFEILAPGHFDIPVTKKVLAFSHPDPQWIEDLRDIHLRKRIHFEGGVLGTGNYEVGYQELKSEESGVDRSDAIFNLDTMDDIVDRLEHLKMSPLSPFDFQHPLISRYLSLRAEGTNNENDEDLLREAFDKQLEKVEEGESLNQRLLNSVAFHVTETQVCPMKLSLHPQLN